MRYFIQFEYNGSAYHGWQAQNNALTVQQVLDKALSIMLGKSIFTIGQGRTDTGVHALKMLAHFDCDSPLVDNMVFKLNRFLPYDIAVHNIFEVNHKAHARFDATARRYVYRTHFVKSTFLQGKSVMLHKQPNIDLMNEAAKMLLQHKNFGAFCKAGAQSHTDECNVTKALWTYDDKELIFTIQANRFLRNMVRAVVGTLLQVGFGDLDLLQFQNILYSQNRSKAGQSMPAEGLFLVDVFYPDWVYIK